MIFSCFRRAFIYDSLFQGLLGYLGIRCSLKMGKVLGSRNSILTFEFNLGTQKQGYLIKLKLHRESQENCDKSLHQTSAK